MAMWFSFRIQHTALPSNHDRNMAPVFRSGGISGALLTDLSKAFDFLLYDLLISTLPAYGLVFIQSYLPEMQQRTKVNNAYSTYSDILYGVPQSSITRPTTTIFILAICFTILTTAILPAMLTTTLHTPVTLT